MENSVINSVSFKSGKTVYVLADGAKERAGMYVTELLKGSSACSEMNLNVVYCCDSICFADDKSPIILIGGENAANSCPANVPIVVSSSNRHALRALGGRKHHAIVCGMYARDTVTLSSYDGEYALVAVQRTLLSVEGEEIEPREVKVYLKRDVSPQHIPLVTAALLISGYYEKNEFEI